MGVPYRPAAVQLPCLRFAGTIFLARATVSQACRAPLPAGPTAEEPRNARFQRSVQGGLLEFAGFFSAGDQGLAIWSRKLLRLGNRRRGLFTG